MTDVFISYSRRDTDFARRLFDSLAAAGRESWVDWEGIPYSADWWREICNGIDAAETFVFIISPDSMTSMVCNQEMAYARQNNKRIVPVMHRQPDEKAMVGEWLGQEWESTARENWTAVKHLNWLFFRAQDDFDASFPALLQTIDQDPEHLRFHTRLLVRAREWDTSQLRDAGLLLRGEDLRQAEGWLEFNKDKAPPPTDLHAHYIRSSIDQRQREEEAEERQRQRLRALVAVLSVLLVIALLASGIAVNRTQVADANAVTAVANADRASTNEAQAESNANQAATSAAEAATNAADARDNAQTADANANLASTSEAEANNNALTATFARGQAEFNALTAVANADLAATNEALAERNAATAERSAAEANSQVLAAAAFQSIDEGDLDTAIIQAIAANQLDAPDFQARRVLYRTVYSPGTSKIVQVKGLQRSVLLAEPVPSDTTAHGVAYTPDGREIVIDAATNLVVLDAKTGEEKRRFFTDQEGFGDVLVTLDGRYILAAVETFSGSILNLDGEFGTGPIIMYDLQTGEEIRRYTGMDESAGVLDIHLSPDGRFLFLRQFPSGIITIWDVETGELVKHLDAGVSVVVSIVFDPSSSILVLTGDSTERGIQAYDLNDDFAPLYTVARYVAHAASVPDRNAFLTSTNGELYMFDFSTGEEIDHISDPWPVTTEGTRSLRVSPNGGFALVETSRGRLLLYDLDDKTRSATFAPYVGLDIYDVEFSPDSLGFVSSAPDDTLRIWDIAPTERYGRLAVPPDALMRWSAHDTNDLHVYRLISDERGSVLQISDLFTQEVQDEIPVSGPSTSVIAISAVSDDGRRAVLQVEEELFMVLNLETGEPLGSFQASLQSARFTPDNQHLAIFEFYRITLLRTDTGERVTSRDFFAEISSDTPFVTTETISVGDIDDDATFVVAGTSQGRIMMFSLPDLALIRIFSQVDLVDIRGLAIAPGRGGDGRLLTVGDLGQVALWDVATGNVLHSFQNRTARALYNVIAFRPDGQAAAILAYGLSPLSELTLWNIYRADEITAQLYAHRAVREPTCEERERFNISPFCTLTGYFPTRTPYPVPLFIAQRSIAPISAVNVLPTFTPSPSPAPGDVLSPTPTARVVTENDLRSALGNIGFPVYVPDRVGDLPLDLVGSNAALGFADLVGEASLDGNVFITVYGSIMTVVQVRNGHADIDAWAASTQFGEQALRLNLLNHVDVNGLDVVTFDLISIGLAVKFTAWIDGDLLLVAVIGEEEMPEPDVLVGAFNDAGLTEPVVRATPVTGLVAQRGENRAELPTSGVHRWTYQGEAGELVTLYLSAANPANRATAEERVERNLLDTLLTVYDPDGAAIGRNDDINDGIVTDSLLRDLYLPTSGEYAIEISSFDFTGGGYTLTISSSLSPTATPTPTSTPMLPPTLTPTITPTPIPTLTAGVMDGGFNVQFSADDRYLITNGLDNAVRLWDATTGELIRSHPGFQVNAAYFSPDGTRYLTNNIPYTVRVFDVATGAELAVMSGHTDEIMRARWSPDSRSIVTGSSDRTSRVWDAATGEERLRLVSHLEEIFGVRYSPDGSRIVTYGYDNNVLIWDALTGEELTIITVDHPTIPGALTLNDVTWSPDGERLAVSSDGDTTIHDAATGELLLTLVGQPDVWMPVWSPDGGLIATTSKVWNAETGLLQYTLERPVSAISAANFNPDGTMIATQNRNMVYLWDALTGRLLRELAHEDEVQIFNWSNDGRRIAVGARAAGVVIWDVATGEETLRLP